MYFCYVKCAFNLCLHAFIYHLPIFFNPPDLSVFGTPHVSSLFLLCVSDFDLSSLDIDVSMYDEDELKLRVDKLEQELSTLNGLITERQKIARQSRIHKLITRLSELKAETAKKRNTLAAISRGGHLNRFH